MAKGKQPASSPDRAAVVTQDVSVGSNGTTAIADVALMTEPSAAADVRAAVRTAFEIDGALRESLAGNLRERGVASQAVLDRANQAFGAFDPSRHAVDRRAGPDYVEPGGDVMDAQARVINEGLDARRQTAAAPSIKLHLTDELKGLLAEAKAAPGSTATGSVDLAALVAYVEARPGGLRTRATDSVLATCKANSDAEKLLEAISGSNGSAAAVASARGGAAPEADADAEIDALARSNYVKRMVDVQMDTVSSPESELQYAIADRAEQSGKPQPKPTFELRPGPTDVVAYHDFYSLHMAFESVWTELFDANLAALGRELYQEYVQLKNFHGVDDGVDATIGGIDDLKRLMDEIKDFSRLAAANIPSGLPGSTQKGVEVGATGIDSTGTRRSTRDGNGELSWEKFGQLWYGDRVTVAIDLDAQGVGEGDMRIRLTADPNLNGRAKGVQLTDNNGAAHKIVVQGNVTRTADMTVPIAAALGGIFDFYKQVGPLNEFKPVYWLEGVTQARFTPTHPKGGVGVTFTWEWDA